MTKPTEEEARIARTETVFRHVNERIAETAEGFSSPESEFVCECADANCQHRLEVPLEEYEDVRDDPTHFLVVEGHEEPAYERVVERRHGYAIVEKFRRGLAMLVRQTDPRAETS
jgi:hypothetical protein